MRSTTTDDAMRAPDLRTRWIVMFGAAARSCSLDMRLLEMIPGGTCTLLVSRLGRSDDLAEMCVSVCVYRCVHVCGSLAGSISLPLFPRVPPSLPSALLPPKNKPLLLLLLLLPPPRALSLNVIIRVRVRGGRATCQRAAAPTRPTPGSRPCARGAHQSPDLYPAQSRAHRTPANSNRAKKS